MIAAVVTVTVGTDQHFGRRVAASGSLPPKPVRKSQEVLPAGGRVVRGHAFEYVADLALERSVIRRSAALECRYHAVVELSDVDRRHSLPLPVAALAIRLIARPEANGKCRNGGQR